MRVQRELEAAVQPLLDASKLKEEPASKRPSVIFDVNNNALWLRFPKGSGAPPLLFCAALLGGLGAGGHGRPVSVLLHLLLHCVAFLGSGGYTPSHHSRAPA